MFTCENKIQLVGGWTNPFEEYYISQIGSFETTS